MAPSLSGQRAGLAAAAVFGEEGEQLVHGLEIGGIDDIAAFLTRRHEMGIDKFLHVEGQRRRRNTQRFADFSGG